MLDQAPRRAQGYLSDGRLGVTTSGVASARGEEHLAVGLFNRQAVMHADGRRVRLIDYQFPLKSVRADQGLGKVDLLGLCDDGVLAVIELKVAGNSEDRRIGLVEGLLSAAIVEANIEPIARELNERRGLTISRSRPRVMIVATAPFWDDVRAIPSRDELRALAALIGSSIPIEIELHCLQDIELLDFGLDGRPPRIVGHGYLSPLYPAQPPHRGAATNEQTDYLRVIRDAFWLYSRSIPEGKLDPRYVPDKHPPVYLDNHATCNVLLSPEVRPEAAKSIVEAIPISKRHRAFASMRSSQALAQSVFAGLEAIGALSALQGLAAEDGYPAFFEVWSCQRMHLEWETTALNEPRATSVDVLFDGPVRVAVEIKFTEGEFGRCSRPQLRETDRNYSRDHCSGDYAVQRERSERCTLTQRGIRYWQFVPQLLAWDGTQDHYPCPLASSYQLVRNILAACVRTDGTLDVTTSHALVVYDARNPAFQPGGAADLQWWRVVAALRYPRLLRRVSWQHLAGHLARVPELTWLCTALQDKYGITADRPPPSGNA